MGAVSARTTIAAFAQSARVACYGAFGALPLSAPGDWRARFSTDRHPNGERPRWVAVAGRCAVPIRADVRRRSLSCWLDGVRALRGNDNRRGGKPRRSMRGELRASPAHYSANGLLSSGEDSRSTRHGRELNSAIFSSPDHSHNRNIHSALPSPPAGLGAPGGSQRCDIRPSSHSGRSSIEAAFACGAVCRVFRGHSRIRRFSSLKDTLPGHGRQHS